MSASDTQIADLPPEKRKILKNYIKARETQTLQCPILPRAPDLRMLPLSFGQERLWFLDQLEPNNPTFNIPYGLRLAGSLNRAALQHSLAEVVRRHESLRTCFDAVDGRPEQRIKPFEALSMPLIDLSHLPSSARETEALRQCVEEARRPFNLAEDLMLRTKLFRLGPSDHILCLNMHHIAFDEWSFGVLLRELAVLYQAHCEGKPAPLPPLPIQYADYAVWQRQWLTGKTLARHLDYWRNHLQGMSDQLDLPNDRKRPAWQTYRGALLAQPLSQKLTSGLKALSQQEGVTLFMTLLAGFQVLLYRYSGREDLSVGSAIANRGRREIDNLIGLFINTLVLRGDLSGNPSFLDLLLHRTREVCLRAYDHQELPFERLVRELKLERDRSRSPLFQVMFLLQSTPFQAPPLPDLETTLFPIDNETSKCDLTVSVLEESGRLKAVAEYNADLFESGTIRRLLGHYEVLLDGIVNHPGQRINALPLLSTAERHQVLVEWNATRQPYPKDQCIHERFEAQVERTPEAVAAVFEGRELSYRELNRRANQLAHYLRRFQVETETLVGVSLDRSLDMLVAVLAVLKAGGAYVPLDPAFPRERLDQIAEDAQIRVLLTQQRFSAQPPRCAAKVLLVDGVDLAAESELNPDFEVTSRNLAYVLFTSGSTGRPKGVPIEHRSVVNFLESMAQAPGLRAEDVLVSVTTLSFDIASLELFLPLTQGARVVIASRETAADGRRLQELLQHSGATVMQATPATWRLLLDAGWSGQPGMKILCGGEALPPELARDLLPRCASLWNMYGPTETTVWSTCCRIVTADGPISIGRPIANTQAYVVDGATQPVPVGVPGELLLGGDGLARGYLHRPDLSAEKFIPDPFSNQPGARLYRTGDMARYRVDGQLECLGRRDHQVKIRGFRIECGEIETLLESHPHVKQCVVAVRGEGADRQLVAYVVPAPGAEAPLRQLREYLCAKLPNYMVPGAFVPMDALPLTPNGKVDRKALPEPGAECLETANFAAPRDAQECQLATIWEKLFNKSLIGINDNFFDLGGHSVLAVRMMAQIQSATGKDLPLVTLFEEPTIAGLARILRDANWRPRWTSLVPIKPEGVKPAFYCVHGEGGNVLEFEHFSRYIDPRQPLYGLQAQGLDGKSPRHQTVEEMAAHYIKEIREFQPQGPYFLGGSSFGGLVALEIARQLTRQGQQVGSLIMFDTYAPGYPQALPSTTAIKTRVAFWRYRFDLHWSNLRAAHGRQRWEYVAAKVKRLWRHLRSETRAHFQIWKNKLENLFYPESIRQVQKAGHQAQAAYHPQPYEGNVILLRATEQLPNIVEDRTNGWSGLALGGVETIDVPGHHGSIMRDPRARVLVEKLTACLERAYQRLETAGK